MASLHVLPPELLIEVLSYLPINALLAFSQTCHSAHTLATSSMHTLSLGIYPTRFSKRIGEIYAADDPCAAAKKVSLLIPAMEPGSDKAALAFHNKLTASIVGRYAGALRHLSLRLWTMSPPIANALAGLSGLQTLTLRIDNPNVKLHNTMGGALRPVSGPAADDERLAWMLLSAASWPSLVEFSLAGGQPRPAHLRGLVSSNPQLRKLVLRNCVRNDTTLLRFICEEWAGGENLRVLMYEDCGSLTLDDIEGVERLRSLQVRCFARFF